MAELIQKQDTLNEGRVKINAAITDAEQAKVTAGDADSKATQALANSENTQTQLDTIVINGDSSVEAAQARVDEKGVGHTTLKDRIDDGFTKVTSQLNETISDLEQRSVNIWSFIDYIESRHVLDKSQWDWSPAFEAALSFLESVGGGVLFVPVGTYSHSRSIHINASSISVVVVSMKSTKMIYTGELYDSSLGTNGIGGLVIGRLPGETSTFRDITVKDISFDGGLKSQWGLYAGYVTEGLNIENVEFRRAVGYAFINNCYSSILTNIHFGYNTPSKPSEMSTTDWNFVHFLHGIVTLLVCHASKMDFIKIAGFGTSGGTPSKTLFKIQGNNISLNNLIIERTWKINNGLTPTRDSRSIDYIFHPTAVFSLIINNVYLEHVDCEAVLRTDAVSNRNITIDDVTINHSYIHFDGVIKVVEGYNLEVGKFFITGTIFNNGNNSRLINVLNGTVQLKYPIIWKEHPSDGDEGYKVFGGYKYADPGESGKIGIPSTNTAILSDGQTLPRVVEGFSVHYGEDEKGGFIGVRAGILINHKGDRVGLGSYSRGDITGWLLRPSTVSGTYYVCIDVFGGIYLENVSFPRVDKNSGKIVLAVATVANGLVTNLVPINNEFIGYYTNNGKNKVVYDLNAPTDGEWTRGDRVINSEALPGKVERWVCVTSGRPGTWVAGETI